MPSPRAFYRDAYVETDRGGRGPEDERTFPLRIAAALRALGPHPKRVLDFGCGTGASSRRLVSAGHTVTGVDASESGIRVARREVPDVRFHHLDSEAELPFEAGSFDACLCTEVIEHLLDVTGFLAEVHRVLVPGGLLVLTTPYHAWLKNLLLITLNFEHHFDPAGEHIRFFTRSSLTRCLREGGFETVHFSGIGRRWPVWKSMFVVARAV